jgi:hypothetical protein
MYKGVVSVASHASLNLGKPMYSHKTNEARQKEPSTLRNVVIVCKMLGWTAIHFVFGAVMTIELTTLRGDEPTYNAMYIFGYVIMGLNALLAVLSARLTKPTSPAFLRPWDFLLQTSLFLMYGIAIYALKFFVAAQQPGDALAGALLLDDATWYVLSTMLKTLVAYLAFNNGLTQLGAGIYAIGLVS